MLARIWDKRSSCTLLVESQLVQQLENSMEVLQKTKNRITIRPRNSTPGCRLKKKKTLIKNIQLFFNILLP